MLNLSTIVHPYRRHLAQNVMHTWISQVFFHSNHNSFLIVLSFEKVSHLSTSYCSITVTS
uniref:Ovule protein n=1 Tax=Brugia timori TaxID=42155 RepID=A0A0R3QHG5_9BILA